MSNDALGDRMKKLEGHETSRRFLPGLTVYARVDGRGFSKFTRGMKRPFDERITKCMIETTKALVADSSATIGYTQSDEISLVWIDPDAQANWFDGKIMKMTSVLAGLTSSAFINALQNTYAVSELSPLLAKLPHFDARVMNMPKVSEAANMLLWRNLDCTKNAVSMAASCFYSHKELMNKSGSEKQEMMFQKGQNFNDYPYSFKRGIWVRKQTIVRTLTQKELMDIPEKNRPDPQTKVTRNIITEFDLPPLNKVSNRVDVLFNGADPINME